MELGHTVGCEDSFSGYHSEQNTHRGKNLDEWPTDDHE